jgi:hypothetical protein
MDENIRTYQFNVPGFIPGIPGNWPAGSWATVDEDNKIVLDWGPKPMSPPALVEEENSQPVGPAQQGG